MRREKEEHPRQEEQYEERCQGMKVQMEQREGGIIQWVLE